MKIRTLVTILTTSASVLFPTTSNAVATLYVATDRVDGYQRSEFKHWIDADKDGCNTRAEVLIEEAIKKPKVGKKCSLRGGKWKSPYDNKIHTKSNGLDIDHLVPLAEAWRSGAYNWSSKQREDYANDLTNPDALVAVTLSVNRTKADRDVSQWLPKYNQCEYVYSWISVKVSYSLTVDSEEADFLRSKIGFCRISGISIQNSLDTPPDVNPTLSPSPMESNKPVPTPSSAAPTPINSSSPSALPTQSISTRIISPGAFCKSEESGLQARSANGTLYTCKVSSTENRLRWRQ